MPKHQTNPTGPRTPTAPTLDAGLSLFAALTTDDPKSVEIADLRAALEDTRKNLESRNLLLIRSKEALSTLGDRLKHSQTTIKTLEANECRLESELDNSRTTIKDNDMKHTATTANLREHLTTVRTQCEEISHNKEITLHNKNTSGNRKYSLPMMPLLCCVINWPPPCFVQLI